MFQHAFGLLGLVPFAFILAVVLLRIAQKKDIIRAFVDGFVAWGFLSFLIAEGLGFFSAVAFGLVLTLWLAAISIVIGLLWPIRAELRKALAITWPEHPVSVAIVAVFVCVTLFIALTATPNNWDSQTYHLVRTEHWIANRSVSHYPTNIVSQNAFGPFSAYLLLHPRLLSGTDAFANLGQWFSMACCVAVAWRITRQLGGDVRRAWIASLFVVTLPIGVLQSTSTMNDYVAGAYAICFVTLGLELIQAPSLRFWLAAEAMTAIALGGTAKAVAYQVSAGFGVWFAIAMMRKLRPAQTIALVVTAFAIIGAVSVPMFVRNVATYGVAAPGTGAILTGGVRPAQIVDNALLNTAINFATGYSWIDGTIIDLVNGITSALGLDRYRVPGSKFELSGFYHLLHEDLAPNAVHVVIIVGAFLVLIAGLIRGTIASTARTYWSAWIAGFLVFCTVMHWNVFMVRFQLQGFVLAAPAVALVWPAFQRPMAERLAFSVLVVIMLYNGLFALLFNATRSLLPSLLLLHLPQYRQNMQLVIRAVPPYLKQAPMQRLFANQPHLLEPYEGAAELVMTKKATNIGLVMADFEYPFWRIFRDRNYPVRIEHVEMSRPTDGPLTVRPDGVGTLSWHNGPFVPEAVIWTMRDPPPEISVAGEVFRRQTVPAEPGPDVPIYVHVYTKL
ncbi:MAG: hypothetical protein GY844_33270 [Bradyrhizobium sp.]|nr:hypothetical protein [Bradyrhizobium sp.]